MHPLLKSVRALLIIATICFATALANAQSMPGYQAQDKAKDQTPVTVKASRGEAPLAKLYGHLTPDASRVKRLPPLDPHSIPKQEKPLEKILNIGVVRTLSSDLNPLTDSAMYSVAEGDVRVAAVTSQGAVYTRLHFKDFSMPAGARVFVYSPADSDVYFGPYEGNGPWSNGVFWSPPLRGDQVIIEYRVPAGTASQGVPFTVNEVSHVYKDVFSANDPAGACNLEVPAEWANIAKSVGLLDFMKGGGEALCTGTLLNDADPTQDHHVLTANHCISSQDEAQSVTVYWNYNTGDTPPGGTPTTTGANLLSTGIWGDFSLLRLTGALPGGLFFSGWDAGAVSSGTSVTGIHHPEGSHKRISFGTTNPDCDSQLPSSCSNFTGVTWSQGTTEDGSSGSGLWTGTPDTAKLVGSLVGGYAACANLSGTDFYTRFSAIYPSVAAFLEPQRTLTVTSVNPDSNVGVIVLLNGNNQPSGSTPFTRTYFHNASVTLTAASSLPNGNTFQKWQRNGQDFTTSLSATVTMNSDLTMTAVYLSPPTFVLTVVSSNSNGGVNITVTPNDRNGSGNGTTEFLRTYNQNTNVNLTAPASANGNTFWKWQVDGVDYIQSQFATVTMNSNHTATAVYFTSTPTPTPTPVPGAGAQPIAFVKPGTSPTNGDDLFLTNPDGTNVVNITDAAGSDDLPAWSPDGSRLAYTCLRQPDGSVSLPRRICVRNADGTGFVVLSNTLNEDIGPTWSRDGSQIAFTTAANLTSQTALGVMNADGTGRFTLFFSGAGDPDWSPDNWTLVFRSFGSIWTYNRLTQTSRGLTNGTFDSRPRYSPDGSKIVFQSSRDGRPQIYVMNSDGSGQTRLTNNTAYETAPAWSPDGTKILFTSLRDGDYALYVMNADGSNPTRVTAGRDGVWRPLTPMPPVIFTEPGTTNAAAVNSVTFVRGPFQIHDSHNFSADPHNTRIILFTSNLGLGSYPLPPVSVLSVQANEVNLPVEGFGIVTGVAGMNGSYIVVRLPDGLPTGNLSLTVTVRGFTSAPTILQIVP